MKRKRSRRRRWTVAAVGGPYTCENYAFSFFVFLFLRKLHYQNLTESEYPFIIPYENVYSAREPKVSDVHSTNDQHEFSSANENLHILRYTHTTSRGGAAQISSFGPKNYVFI